MDAKVYYQDMHRDVAQLGSAPALGAGCRRFKSCHPDFLEQIKLEQIKLEQIKLEQIKTKGLAWKSIDFRCVRKRPLFTVDAFNGIYIFWGRGF